MVFMEDRANDILEYNVEGDNLHGRTAIKQFVPFQCCVPCNRFKLDASDIFTYFVLGKRG